MILARTKIVALSPCIDPALFKQVLPGPAGQDEGPSGGANSTYATKLILDRMGIPTTNGCYPNDMLKVPIVCDATLVILHRGRECRRSSPTLSSERLLDINQEISSKFHFCE